MRKRKIRRKKSKPSKSRSNNHHILYQRRFWDRGNAKRLRDFWYCQVELPIKDLHNPIHHALNSVPVPDGNRCNEALTELRSLEELGALRNDASIVTRIDVLLCIWEGYKDCEATCKALKIQRAIAENYYLSRR